MGKYPCMLLVILSWLFTANPAATLTNPPAEPPAEEAIYRQAIVQFAEQYLGLPYVWGSRDPKRGFDCSGFTSYVMKNFDIDLSPSSSMQSTQGNKIQLSDVQPGDLIFFRRSSRSRVFHVAMVYGVENDDLQIIHSTRRGVVIDHLNESTYWRTKYKTARNVMPGQFPQLILPESTPTEGDLEEIVLDADLESPREFFELEHIPTASLPIQVYPCD